MSDRRKRSDTSLINYMHNYKVAVQYDGTRWVANTEHTQGYGDTVRLALYDLETQTQRN